MNDLIVQRVDAARRLLIEATTPQALKAVVDVAHAAKVYATRQKMSRETIDYAHCLEVDSLHRLGQTLADAKDAGTLAGKGERKCSGKEHLTDLGIDRKTSMVAQRLARLDDSQLEAVKAGAQTISAAVKAVKQQRAAEVIQLRDDTCTVADLHKLAADGRRFGTIYADPPWQYGNQSTRGAMNDHYIGMGVDEIAELPVVALAAEQAHLHLWTTNAFLFDCQRIMQAWGFEYKSCYVWVKPQIGMGNYWRVSHEFLLLGVRGSCAFADRSLRSWGEFRRGQHSAKPDEIRTLIERASPGPRLELFGRRVARDWTVWGNEIKRAVFDVDVREVA
jgi:N6-adenosine-specific RNA methylase IME4